MLHIHTHRLIDEWRRQKGVARLPARPQMTAAAFGTLLPQIFILGLEAGEWRFRLAGGFLFDLHGRELRGRPLLEAWAQNDGRAVARAADGAVRTAEPVILAARADAGEERWAALEIGLAPLTGPTEAPDRLIGLVQPTSMMARLRGAPVPRLDLVSIRSDAERPPLRLVVDNTARPRG